MNKTKDGGPAFPAEAFAAQHAPGMTLRDWFAGQALIGLLADPNARGCAVFVDAASDAYEAADAMLAARTGEAA